MKLRVLAIGKIGQGAESNLCTLYRDRIHHLKAQAGINTFDILELPEQHKSTPALSKGAEKTLLMEKIKENQFIALDERAKPITSSGFADILFHENRDIDLVIGGHSGLENELLQKANTTLSFGRMTLPHKLVRVLILEQIYRALTIRLNHPYPRE